MTHPNMTRFSTRLRLLCGLALLIGLCIMMGGLARPAHAQSTLSVSDCRSDTQLQAAVAQANSDNAGDVITFACSGDITLTSTLTISGSMTLSGSGQRVTLDGNVAVQVLSVQSGVTFALNALTIDRGFGATLGSGLLNHGGTVNISNSTFDGNFALSGSGGGLFNEGGTVNISNSTFSYNSADNGGGLTNDFGTVNISNSTFTNNTAGMNGGGIFNAGTVNISNSTFTNNFAVSGNGGGFGGGIENANTVSITTSTFANNSAAFAGGGIDNTDRVSIGGSIVAENTGGDCQNSFIITDQGYNLDSDSSCFTASTSLHTNPQLSPLAHNGGPTQTMALQQGSPAIDAIPLSANLCPGTDQRGNGRPDTGESSCDMGAYEFADPADKDLGLSNLPADITVNASSPQGAVVTYTSPTVVDESGDSSTASVSCTPASGSTFPIGTTKVTCSASDSDDTNSPVSGSFQVVVKDVTAPTLSVPSTITVDATSPQGASVTYSVSATDPDNAASELKISCSPASGSTFAIGTTTVHCTATDPSGNSNSGSFQVVVKGAAAQVSDLVTTVNGDHLSSSLQNSLDNKLKDTLTAINAGQTATACSELTDFSGYVQSHTGKGITSSQATQLMAAAKQVQAVFGC